MKYFRTLIATLIGLMFLTQLSWAADYSGYDDEAELYAIVKALPAHQRSENAAGYARLMELNPSNEMYKAKYARYSAPAAKRPSSVNSVNDLRRFLVGNWCVLYESTESWLPNKIWKIIVSENGDYLLYKKSASDPGWGDNPDKGRFKFGEGRYSDTGTKYFYAQRDDFRSNVVLDLTVDAGGSTTSVRNLKHFVGNVKSRNSCAKYE